MFTMNHTSTQALRAALGVTRNMGLPAARTAASKTRLPHRIRLVCRWVPLFRAIRRHYPAPCSNN
jgi:hypothetical protein